MSDETMEELIATLGELNNHLETMQKQDSEESLQYIRDHYGVPAKKGGRIRINDKLLGTITGGHNQYLKVNLDDGRQKRLYHPTWKIEYLAAKHKRMGSP